jgi:hypothetical protein
MHVRLLVRLAPVAGLAVAIALAAAASIPAAEPSGGAQPRLSRTLDRTFVCSTIPQGGFRKVNVYAQAGVREFGEPQRWKTLPHAWFKTGSIYESEFIGVTAGSLSPGESSGLYLKRKQCRASAGRIALSPAGLTGGPADQLGDEYECEAPRTVLVRVRAVFRRPTRLTSKPFGHLGTSAPGREAAMVVGTPAGKRLAYVGIAESGKARLFTGPTCIPE